MRDGAALAMLAALLGSASCSALLGITPGNPENEASVADAARDASAEAALLDVSVEPSNCDSSTTCEVLASSGRDGDATVATAIDLNAASVGATADANGSAADGVAYRVASAPTGTTIEIGTEPLGFSTGDKALLVDLQAQNGNDADVGNWEIVDVEEVSATALRVKTPLARAYAGSGFPDQRVVIQRIPQYGRVTIAAGGVVRATAWNGLAGAPASVATGIVAFFAQSLTIEDGGRIDVTGLGHAGGEPGGPGPESVIGIFSANADSGKSGGQGAPTGGESNGGPGGAGGGALLGGLGGIKTTGNPGNVAGARATGGGGGGAPQYASSDTFAPGKGGDGHEGGGGGGGRNDNSASWWGGAGGGGKPVTYGVRTDTSRTDSTCSRMTLSGGSPAGAGGGKRAFSATIGAGGAPTAGLAGGRGAGIVLIRAGSIVSTGTGQIVADGTAGGGGADGEDGIAVPASRHEAGGGGGAGAQGATGGSICLFSARYTIAVPAASARGGNGGNGGRGGSGTGSDGSTTAKATAGVGGIFADGNDRGTAGGGGSSLACGGGGGGGGGNSGWAGILSTAPLL